MVKGGDTKRTEGLIVTDIYGLSWLKRGKSTEGQETGALGKITHRGKSKGKVR